MPQTLLILRVYWVDSEGWLYVSLHSNAGWVYLHWVAHLIRGKDLQTTHEICVEIGMPVVWSILKWKDLVGTVVEMELHLPPEKPFHLKIWRRSRDKEKPAPSMTFNRWSGTYAMQQRLQDIFWVKCSTYCPTARRSGVVFRSLLVSELTLKRWYTCTFLQIGMGTSSLVLIAAEISYWSW